jgi:hypothetical protein
VIVRLGGFAEEELHELGSSLEINTTFPFVLTLGFATPLGLVPWFGFVQP